MANCLLFRKEQRQDNWELKCVEHSISLAGLIMKPIQVASLMKLKWAKWEMFQTFKRYFIELDFGSLSYMGLLLRLSQVLSSVN